MVRSSKSVDMCSILGFVSSKQIKKELFLSLQSSSEIMKHRGPDAQKYFIADDQYAFFAHNRLSIIDLDAHANQPFRIDNFIITFNGEIYNYKELKQQFFADEILSTSSDTEVLLRLYILLGKDCLQYLRGMFAFAIYDLSSKELFCARDRIGEKPFVYACTESGFLFASEVSAIVSSNLIDTSINEEIKNLYFAGNFKHIPEPYTLYKNIYKLKPSSYIVVKKGKIVEENFYWFPKIVSKKNNAKTLKKQVIESISLASTADVPIAILLSGGTDSSIIAHVLKNELHKNFVAFCFGYDENDEEIKRARFVANYLEIELKELYIKDYLDEALNILEKLIAQIGEPVYLLQLVYSKILYENIHKSGFKVVLTGNGADELFYGYTAHNRTLLFSKFFRYIPFISNYNLKKYVLKRSLMKKTLDFIPNINIINTLFTHWKPFFKPLNEGSYIDLSNIFGLILENSHSITKVADIAGMAESVEARSPFLDHKLIEMALSLKAEQKIGKLFDNTGSYNKHILKQAFKDDLPKEVLYAPKVGFGYYIGEKKFFHHNPQITFGEWVWNQCIKK